MKNKKRKYIWVSLILTCALCISGHIHIGAVSDMDISGDEQTYEQVVEWDGQEEQIDMPLVSVGDVKEEPYEGENPVFGEEASVISSDDEISGEDLSSVSFDDGMIEVQEEIISDDDMGEDVLSENRPIVSDDQIIDEDVRDTLVDVALPTEISFNMLFIGDERKDGNIASKAYCIENKGYTDVRVLVQSICRGRAEEEYFFSDSSVRKGMKEERKKNVWIYMKWAREEDDDEFFTVVLGDAFSPREEEIVLKAPKRNDDGNIIGNDPESRIYFSFEGDVLSDTDEIWKSGELEVDLRFLMEAVGMVSDQETADYPEEGEDAVTDIVSAPDLSDLAVVSDNDQATDTVSAPDLSDTAVVSDNDQVTDTVSLSDLSDPAVVSGNDQSWDGAEESISENEKE